MKSNKQLYILLILAITFIPAAYFFVTAVLVIHISHGNFNVISQIKSNIFFLIVSLYIVIGVVASRYVMISLIYGMLIFLCFYSIILTTNLADKINIKELKKIIYIVSLAVFIIGILQYLNPNYVMPSKWVDGEEFRLKKRIFSTFFNPNVFGFYINVILIILSGEINLKKNNISIMEILLFFIGLICLFLTFSRTAWISLVIAFIISGLLFDKKYFKFALFVFVVIVGFDEILHIGRSNPGKIIEDSSVFYRIEIWEACFKIIKDNFLTGIGFGTLFKYITNYSDVVKPNIEHCHNMYIQILMETGVFGFCGFLFMINKLIYYLWTKTKKRNNQKWITSFSLVVMVLIHGSVDSVLLTPQIMMILCICIGVMSGMERSLYIPIAIQ